jgi:hypothetical protein
VRPLFKNMKAYFLPSSDAFHSSKLLGMQSLPFSSSFVFLGGFVFLKMRPSVRPST